MTRTLLVTMLAACLAVAGCGKDSGTQPSERIPSYAGNWSGNYTITGCNQSGSVALANLCGSIGGSAPYTFSLTQNGRNVSGSFFLGSISFPNTGGTVAQDGSLALQGTSISNGITIVVNWALNMPAAALTGTVSQQWTSNGLTGQANVVGSVTTSIRNASSLAPATSSLHSGFDPSAAVRALSGRE
jgi:hypothetical protein